jgi:phage repressor protein C with HTH and peptisase S24 domain
MSNIKERILTIPEKKGISKEYFFSQIGMTYGNFKGKSKNTPINSNAIVDILSIYPDISIDWLVTGSGSMIKSLDPVGLVQEPVSAYGMVNKDSIPLVNGNAIGGFGGSQFSIDKIDVKEYYVVPKFKNKKIDFMIEVEGSSMYPKYNSGDVVACRIINESNFIQWNKAHVVATRDQGILLKRIKPGKETDVVTLISDNKDYDPFNVSMQEITGMAIVVGVIRLE